MFLPVFICLSVCEHDYSKKVCMDLDEMLHVGTRTNWLTFDFWA